MSWQATNWATEQRVGDPTLKLLLLVICNYANTECQTWYTQEKISYDTEIPVRTLRRKLQKLAELNFISVEERRRNDGTKTSSMITVLTPSAILAGGPIQRPKEGITSGQKRPQPAANMVAEQDSSENKQELSLRLTELKFAESKPHPAKKRCTIPKSFPMTDRHRKYAAERGIVGSYADNIFENFKNHHAAKGTLMLDWDCAWQTWVGNEVKYNAARMAPKTQQSMVYGDDYQ